MKLYDATPSPNCRRVRILVRELGLPLELVPQRVGGAPDPAYLAQNPSGKVPTFVDDDGFVLWESGAILLHLAEKKPDLELWPREPHARADVTRWMFFVATHLQPWVSVLGQERVMKPRTSATPDDAAIKLAERELARFLPLLDAALGEREYLVGRFTIADIFAGSTLEQSEARGISLARYAGLTAWRERLRERPAWRE